MTCNSISFRHYLSASVRGLSVIQYGTFFLRFLRTSVSSARHGIVTRYRCSADFEPGSTSYRALIAEVALLPVHGAGRSAIVRPST